VEKELRRLDGELRHLTANDTEDKHALRRGALLILLAIDCSAPSLRAAETAAVLAEACGGRVLVLHVREIDPACWGVSLETPSEAKALVCGVADSLLHEGVNALALCRVARRGHVARVIAEVALRVGADLVVMGSRGSSRLATLLSGSIAQQTIRRARCPVLVVR
jgi:nucleotide-binding universal stress UspA family protein